MKKKITILTCAGALFLLSCASAPRAYDRPVEGLRFLAESRVETCAKCVYELQKKGFKSLNSALGKGTLVRTGAGLSLVRTRECSDGEFVLAPPLKRETVNLETGAKAALPLVTFYFHTKRHSMAGIDPSLRTEEKMDAVYGPAAFRGEARFEGTLEVIPYAFGDGRTFVYYEKQNKIQIHCRVVELRKKK